MLKRIKITKDRYIGENEPCFIIAEAGSNHNGSLELARKLIDVAVEAKADAIKFQVFRARTMYPKKSISVKYLKNIGIKDSLYDIIKRFEVPYSWIEELCSYAKQNNIEFIATPFDLRAVALLNPYINIFKIASYESLFLDLLCAVKKTNKPIFISTGGCTEDEIDLLINKVLFDYLDKTVLLHCVAKYPAPVEQTNLSVLPHLSKKYCVHIGYSDHTREPIVIPVSAVVLGAKVIEKHFTLSRNLPGPDHAFALEPNELKAMIEAIRKAEKTITYSNRKILQSCEKELYYYKRCVYCNADLKRGSRIKRSNIVILRNTGIQCDYFNPIEIDLVIGKTLRRDKKANDVIIREDLE